MPRGSPRARRCTSVRGGATVPALAVAGQGREAASAPGWSTTFGAPVKGFSVFCHPWVRMDIGYYYQFSCYHSYTVNTSYIGIVILTFLSTFTLTFFLLGEVYKTRVIILLFYSQRKRSREKLCYSPMLVTEQISKIKVPCLQSMVTPVSHDRREDY